VKGWVLGIMEQRENGIDEKMFEVRSCNLGVAEVQVFTLRPMFLALIHTEENLT
jgi:hypothetical protein